MFYVIAFDISDNRVRYRVVKVLKGVGTRVQKSVFECSDLNEQKLLKIQSRVDAMIDHATDTVRYYRLCKACLQEVEWNGTGVPPRNQSFEIV
jgi:CRISPR-associated protein Cas2